MAWRRIGERRCSSSVLDLGTRWRWMASLTLRSLFPLGKSPRYSSDNRSGRLGKEKNIVLTGIEPGSRSYIYCAVWKDDFWWMLNFVGVSRIKLALDTYVLWRGHWTSWLCKGRGFSLSASQEGLIGSLKGKDWYMYSAPLISLHSCHRFCHAPYDSLNKRDCWPN
jgi:hypothetical protein